MRSIVDRLRAHWNEPPGRSRIARRLASPDRAVPALVRGCELPNRVLVASHHKTGTVWLGSIFRAISAFHGLVFVEGEQRDLPERWDLFFQDHSRFDFDRLAADPRPIRGVHMIRDPRDVVVSGCFYHATSREEWLHVCQPWFGGRSYQEALNALDDPGDRLMFEMEQAGRMTIEEMLAWDYERPDFLELRYETLIRDTELERFHELFIFLGFPGSVLPSLLAFAWRESLFSGASVAHPHVRSGRGGQWPAHFEPRHRRRFVELFGDALVRLGYEPDDAWVEQT